MRDELEERYTVNLSRVRRLIEFHRELLASGHQPTDTLDVLRAGVVFLHATIEDVLRTLLLRRWPLHGTPEQLADIPVALGPDRQQRRVTLGELVGHRGKTIDGLLRESIAAYLERSSFNHVGDVKTALVRSGLDPRLIAAHAGTLAALMSRRHQIVHRADRPDVSGSGDLATASLEVDTVIAWFQTVEGACGDIVAQL